LSERSLEKFRTVYKIPLYFERGNTLRERRSQKSGPTGREEGFKTRGRERKMKPKRGYGKKL